MLNNFAPSKVYDFIRGCRFTDREKSKFYLEILNDVKETSNSGSLGFECKTKLSFWDLFFNLFKKRWIPVSIMENDQVDSIFISIKSCKEVLESLSKVDGAVLFSQNLGNLSEKKITHRINDFIYKKILQKNPLQVSLMHLGLSENDYQMILDPKMQFIEYQLPIFSKFLDYYTQDIPAISLMQFADYRKSIYHWEHFFLEAFKRAEKDLTDVGAMNLLKDLKKIFFDVLGKDEAVSHDGLNENDHAYTYHPNYVALMNEVFDLNCSQNDFYLSHFAATRINSNPKGLITAILGLKSDETYECIYELYHQKIAQISRQMKICQEMAGSRLAAICLKTDECLKASFLAYDKKEKEFPKSSDNFIWDQNPSNRRLQIAKILHLQNYHEIQEALYSKNPNDAIMILRKSLGIEEFRKLHKDEILFLFNSWLTLIHPSLQIENQKEAYEYCTAIVESLKGLASMEFIPNDYKPNDPFNNWSSLKNAS